MLQWGRRFLTAETCPDSGEPTGEQLASMGPPFFDGGNLKGSQSMSSRVSASMGPPFFDGGNMFHSFQEETEANVLQWGRRFLTAETDRFYLVVCAAVIASMGPPFFDGGNDPAENG